jgi:hypothetical protein
VNEEKDYKKLYLESERNRKLTQDEAQGYLLSLNEQQDLNRALRIERDTLRYQLNIIRSVFALDRHE